MLSLLRQKLDAAFAPSALEIIDESHLHAGHAGARPGGNSHFRVRIVSDAFRGVSRVQRHQKIYGALAEEMKTIHALAIDAKTPEEL